MRGPNACASVAGLDARRPHPPSRAVPSLAQLFGRWFWLTGYLAIAGGLLLPGDLAGGRPAIPWLLGGVLFFTCLKVRLGEVAGALRGGGAWARLAGLSALKLLLVPLLVLAVAVPLCPTWAAGLVLVSAMPAGMTSAAFTDLQRGNVALALLVILATSLLSPLTVPPLTALACHAAGEAAGTIDGLLLARQALFIALLLLIPFALAQVVRHLAPTLVQRQTDRLTGLAMTCNAALLFVGAASTRALLPSAVAVAVPLAACGAASLAFLLLGRLLRRRLPAGDAVAATCGLVYMNNALGLVFALAFFADRPALVLPPLLMTVPMVAVVCLAGRVVGRAPGR